MPTPFTKVYDTAIRGFDDPFLSSKYHDRIYFYRVMYNYLMNAIPQFSIPIHIPLKLSKREDEQYNIELFSGDGVSDTFFFTNIPPSIDVLIRSTVGDVEVSCDYDISTNTITLSEVPPLGVDNVKIEWYFSGEFLEDLSDDEIRILGMLTVLQWAEKEKNYLMDIRRLLNDTDFRLHSEANSIRGKGNWYTEIRENCDQLMKALSWRDYLTSKRGVRI